MTDFDKIERRLRHLCRIMRRARETGREAEAMERLPEAFRLLSTQAQLADDAAALEQWDLVIAREGEEASHAH